MVAASSSTLELGLTNPPQLLHADLTYAIRGVLFDVGNHLGAQLPEADFQQAVSIGLTKRGIAHELEKEFHVTYRGARVGRYFCDLWVEDTVVLELKVAPEITNKHRAQMLSYIRVMGADVGLLAAFGGKVRIACYYEGQYISSRKCYLLVMEDTVLLAVFAVSDMTPARLGTFETQMRRYLKYLGKELGLLANFGGERLVVTPVRVGEKTGADADGETHDG